MEKEENIYFRQLLDIKNANSYDHMITNMPLSVPQHLDILGTLKQTLDILWSWPVWKEKTHSTLMCSEETLELARAFMGKATHVKNPE